jgi:DNA-binding NarL/FixJ family response regulator
MRVLIADDQVKVRSALRLWLGRRAGIQVLGEAVDARGVLDWVTAACPDVLLLDWELPGREDLDLVSQLRKRYPDVVIIALSGRAGVEGDARAAGVEAFVSKCGPPEGLALALEGVGGHDA